MCLLFLYLNKNPYDSDYRLIIASNRDESWNRPTDTAKFRGGGNQWIGGVDLAAGREGGTWLGISTSGKFGALLDITAKTEHQRLCRGHFVPDYLCSNENGGNFLRSLKMETPEYKPFKLVLLDIKDKPDQIYYFDNYNLKNEPVNLKPGVHSFDNSNDLNKPWKKTVHGKSKFCSLLQEHPKIQQNKILTNQLIDMLNDKTQYFPDKQLETQFIEAELNTDGDMIKQRSAINVFSPHINAGTRTNTVILVDFLGNCYYVERTLETPIIVERPTWTRKEYSFQLDI